MSENLSNDLREIRERLDRGLHSTYQALSFRCILFYADMVQALHGAAVRDRRTVEALLEVFRTVPAVVTQYEELSEVDACRKRFGALALFGMVQCMSHLVDATARLCMIFRVSNEGMKRKEYWKFRTRHTHGSGALAQSPAGPTSTTG